MGKKKQKADLGKSLIKDRFGSKSRRTKDSFLHTSELNDGYDWGRLNLTSVTEQSTLEEFLTTATLAGTEFQAEKLNVTLVNPEKHTGLLSKAEEEAVKETQDKHRQFLSIPRRPQWDANTTAVELDQKERESFLEWRRKLAELQDVEGLVMTPFERNLDFWRQLWRVLERSDVVVQIVDARNPLLFYCDDVDSYAKELDEKKVRVLLINKADYLTEEQRSHWAKYFSDLDMRVIFWSAALQNEANKLRDEEENETDDVDEEEEAIIETDDEYDEEDEEDVEVDDEDEDDEGWEDEDEEDIQEEKADSPEKGKIDVVGQASEMLETVQIKDESAENSQQLAERVESELQAEGGINVDTVNSGADSESAKSSKDMLNSSDIVTGDELVEIFKSLHSGTKYQEGITTIGLVGYPNVGKSSTINAILRTKKVPVSATPGRTKHFQTLFVEPTVMLCDCPGLVMPTFVSTKAEMVNSGILPIDQMRDYIPPVSLVCKHIPRNLLELTYGLMLPKPNVEDGEEPDRIPTAHELLGTYACMRGYMTHKGIPDFQRASRFILKDYMNGKLLYCHGPPDVDVSVFKPTPELPNVVKIKSEKAPTMSKVAKKVKSYGSAVDTSFFGQMETRVGSKGKDGKINYTRTDGLVQHHGNAEQVQAPAKPWRLHHNKGKKEKQRRMTGYLDA